MMFCFIYFQTRKNWPIRKEEGENNEQNYAKRRKLTRKFTKCNAVLKQWTTARGRRVGKAWKSIS